MPEDLARESNESTSSELDLILQRGGTPVALITRGHAAFALFVLSAIIEVGLAIQEFSPDSITFKSARQSRSPVAVPPPSST